MPLFDQRAAGIEAVSLSTEPLARDYVERGSLTGVTFETRHQVLEPEELKGSSHCQPHISSSSRKG